MKKLIAPLVIAALLSFGVGPAKAEIPHSIAVIDTGFNLSGIEDRVVAEACVIDKRIGCNNRSGLDVSKGASQTTNRISSRYQSDWKHGTDMINAIISEDPDANIVAIRNSAVIGSLVIPGGEADFVKALNWVAENAERYNIVAVSFSRGEHRYVSKNSSLSKARATVKSMQSLVNILTSRGVAESRVALYQSRLDKAIATEKSIVIKCSASQDAVASVDNLLSIGIPVFVATGNNSDKRFVDSPACIESTVSVTALDGNGSLLPIANAAQTTDFGAAALNTSTATARLAGIWSLVYNSDYRSTYDLIKKSTIVNSSIYDLLTN
jgi:hypothetical protein